MWLTHPRHCRLAMLSYRHAFHAGNFADILKHLVLTSTLHYATRKDAPLFYLDSHAGAGLYRLRAKEAQLTGEAKAGILKLDFVELLERADADGKAALKLYHNSVASFLQNGKYPGSPLLAAALLRRRDHLHLCELHPSDFILLEANTNSDPRIHCERSDGFLTLTAQLPPVQKRAVVLIDPSYELTDDYTRVVRAVADIHKRMPTAQVLLWYPVVQRAQTDRMLAALLRTSVKDLWQFELGLEPDTDTHGMTACGMLALNPPWTLPAQLRNCLPLIQEQLAPALGHAWVRNLVGE